MFYGLLIAGASFMEDQFGLLLSVRMLSQYEWGLLAMIVLSAVVIGFLPAYRAYRYSLSDGITIKT